MRLDLLPFVFALVLTLILTPMVRKVAVRLKVLDHPTTRKIHSNPTPLLGSVGVYLGFCAGLTVSSVWNFVDRDIIVLLGCGSFLLLIGVLDDWNLLHPQIKLMVAMPISGLILIFSNLHLRLFDVPFLNYFFTLFWVVGITAAYNLLDGMDGLSAGVCVIASVSYLFFGMVSGDVLLVVIALSLGGACLGFLVFNFHPAKIFLGDGGAIFLGFLLAAMGLRVAESEDLPVLTRWMLPILILCVPIFDTSLVTFSRLRRGLIPFLHPGKDHSHHRLLNLGFGQRKTAVLIYLFGTAGGLLSWMICYLPPFGAYVTFCILLLCGIVLVFFFEKLPYDRQERSRSYSTYVGGVE